MLLVTHIANGSVKIFRTLIGWSRIRELGCVVVARKSMYIRLDPSRRTEYQIRPLIKDFCAEPIQLEYDFRFRLWRSDHVYCHEISVLKFSFHQ